jgi:adenosylhomocysteine nucleosidase
MIGIIGALEEEIIYLKNLMSDVEQEQTADMTFFKGVIDDTRVVVVRCGIGKVHAAICAQILIDGFGADTIINVGVAGGVHKDLTIGDIVISSETVQHDMDATAFGYGLGEIPNTGMTYFRADERLVVLAAEAAEKKEITYKIGCIGSGDLGVDSNAIKDRLRENFGCLAAEMEGAAIAQVCHINKIPYLVIRAISDNADENAEESFTLNLVEAAHRADYIAEEVIRYF